MNDPDPRGGVLNPLVGIKRSKNMKHFILVAVAIFALNPLFAGEKNNSTEKSSKKISCEERRKVDNAKSAKKYQERAEKQLATKLSKCHDKASGKVREAALKEVELQKSLGALYQKISNAYKNDDQESLKSLREEKCKISESLDIAYRKTKMARYTSGIEEKIKKYPESAKLKDLSRELSELSNKYLEATNEIINKTRERAELEKQIKEINNEAYKAMRASKKKKSSCKPCK